MSRFLPRGRRLQLASAGIALLALAVFGSIVLVVRGNRRGIAPPAPTGSAQHVDFTLKSSLLALVHSADLICACTVLSSSPRYTATPRVDGNGAVLLPVSMTLQDFSVRVDRILRSTSDPAQTITVTQSSSPGDPAAVKDNPPLVAGSRYVLFLKRAANGKYGVVSGPQGLLLLDVQNRLQPALTGDPVTGLLRNRRLDEIVDLLRGVDSASPSPAP